MRKGVPLKTSVEVTSSMSREEFAQELKRGRKLVLLDDLVLDITEFVSEHPGGKFVMNHNVGRDISKFFFGGYCLEDNDKPNNRGHNHSVYARMIVN
jgi:stearoyl-CoA desaturase (delta-9 desaturase)